MCEHLAKTVDFLWNGYSSLMKRGWQPGWFPTHEDEKRWDLPDSTYCSEGLADLIPNDSRWCVFPHSKILWKYCLYDKAQQFCHVRSVRVGRNMWKLHITSQYIFHLSFRFVMSTIFHRIPIYIYPILYFHIIMWPIFLLGLFLLQFHSFRGGRKPACSSMKACWLWPRAITPVPGAGKPNQWLKSGKSLAFGRFDGLIITEYESFWTFRASNIFCLSSHLSTDLFRSCI